MIVEDGAATRLHEHELAVNGITLHVATWGARTTPDRAVLLVHGLTTSSRSWAAFGPTLAAHGVPRRARVARRPALLPSPAIG